jgi:hypothetical protein
MTINTPDTTTLPTSDGVSREVLASATLTRLLPEFKGLLLEELVPVNVDVPSAVATVLGSLPEIRALRDEIAKSMSNFDLVSFDKLEDYALALNDAHGEYLTATQPTNDLQQLIDEGTKLRGVLFSDATALALRGLIDEKKLSELKGTVGYKNLATDLNVLYKVLSSSWEQIAGKCAVQQSELERAAKLGQHLIRVVGLREQGTASVAAATDLRMRAFTLFVRTYDHTRRAVNFLRWNEGDAEKIAPSLYAGRTVRRKGADVPVEGAPAPTVPLPGGSATPASTTPGIAPSGAASSATRTPASEPFLQ